jgi:hypothetical protein
MVSSDPGWIDTTARPLVQAGVGRGAFSAPLAHIGPKNRLLRAIYYALSRRSDRRLPGPLVQLSEESLL